MQRRPEASSLSWMASAVGLRRGTSSKVEAPAMIMAMATYGSDRIGGRFAGFYP
jgi:hypothetical protein